MAEYALDPNMLVNALANKDDDSIGGGNGLLWIFLLILFWGMGGNGFGGFGNGGTGAVINDAAITSSVEAAMAKAQASNLSDTAILTAINGNENSIKELAMTFGVQTEAIRSTLSQLGSGVCELGHQMAQDTASVIAQVSSGNASLSRQLADCCCATQRAIDSVKYDMATGFCAVNTNINQSTAALEKYIDKKIDIAQMENRAGFQGIRDYMTAEKITQLQSDLQAAQLTLSNTAQTQTLINYIDSKCTQS